MNDDTAEHDNSADEDTDVHRVVDVWEQPNAGVDEDGLPVNPSGIAARAVRELNDRKP